MTNDLRLLKLKEKHQRNLKKLISGHYYSILTVRPSGPTLSLINNRTYQSFVISVLPKKDNTEKEISVVYDNKTFDNIKASEVIKHFSRWFGKDTLGQYIVAINSFLSQNIRIADIEEQKDYSIKAGLKIFRLSLNKSKKKSSNEK